MSTLNVTTIANVGGTTAATIDNNGHLTINNATLTNVNSAGFYRAGTWTPVFADAPTGGNTSSTTAQTSNYVKIGSLVHVNFRFDNISTAGLTSGQGGYFQGLPFAPNADANGSLWFQSVNVGSNPVFIVPRAFVGSNYIRLEQVNDNAADTLVTVAGYGNGTADVRVSMTYTTNE